MTDPVPDRASTEAAPASGEPADTLAGGGVSDASIDPRPAGSHAGEAGADGGEPDASGQPGLDSPRGVAPPVPSEPTADARPAEPEARSPEHLLLKLDGFEGPLDLLLDLARAQKVDLAKISILALVDQYLAVIDGARRIRLELAAEWLVMAAWLTWLKSRLLVPEAADPLDDPERVAEDLTERLRALELVRAAAGWLNRHPILGQDVFALGAREDHTVIDRSRLVIDQAAFLASYLRALRRGTKPTRYEPRKLSWYTVQDALKRLGSLLGSLPDWSSLERFLPEGVLTDPMEQRAAMSSTLLAGLELARGGQLRLRQEEAFGPILVGPGEAEA